MQANEPTDERVTSSRFLAVLVHCASVSMGTSYLSTLPGSGVDRAGVGGRERDHDFGSRNAFVENADGTMSRLASARTHAKKAQ